MKLLNTSTSNRIRTCEKSMIVKLCLANLRKKFKAKYQIKLLKDIISKNKYKQALEKILTDNQIKVLVEKSSRY